METFLNNFLFGLYPYICMTVFFVGNLVRYDREQYSWKAQSSQLLADKGLRIGNILFHIGVLFLLFGHFFGLLTPHFLYDMFITASQKQMLAIVSGGIAGGICFIGLTILLFRRLFVERIRATSSNMDITILILLWLQLTLGMISILFSLEHPDGNIMLRLADWAQRIMTFRSGAAEAILGLSWVYQLHLVLGMSIFLIFPFTRLVHIWSLPIFYIFRPYQIVRSRKARA